MRPTPLPGPRCGRPSSSGMSCSPRRARPFGSSVSYGLGGSPPWRCSTPAARCSMPRRNSPSPRRRQRRAHRPRTRRWRPLALSPPSGGSRASPAAGALRSPSRPRRRLSPRRRHDRRRDGRAPDPGRQLRLRAARRATEPPSPRSRRRRSARLSRSPATSRSMATRRRRSCRRSRARCAASWSSRARCGRRRAGDASPRPTSRRRWRTTGRPRRRPRNAKRIADRDEELFKNDALARSDLDQARTDAAAAAADLDAAGQQLRALGVDRQRSPPSATAGRPPVRGRHSRAHSRRRSSSGSITPGQVLEAGATPTFTIADLKTMWVFANVYGADLATAHEGETAEIFTDATPDDCPAGSTTSPRSSIPARRRPRCASSPTTRGGCSGTTCSCASRSTRAARNGICWRRCRP